MTIAEQVQALEQEKEFYKKQCAELTSPLNLAIWNRGTQALVDDLLARDGAYAYLPPVFKTTEDDEVKIIEFNLWYNDITPDSFTRQPLMQLLSVGGIAFEDVRSFLKEKLYQIYIKRVEECNRKNETV